MKTRLVLIFSIALLALSGVFIGCDNNVTGPDDGDGDGNGDGDEEKPELSNPNPPDGATGVDFLLDSVSWECTNPTGANLTFDVYFGESGSPLDLIANDIPDTKCPIGPLEEKTGYQWQVTVDYGEGLTEWGPEWEFETAESPGWHIEIVDYIGEFYPFYDISLTIDSGDNLYMSYYSMGDHGLKYAYTSGRGWTTEIVDTDGYMPGQGSSIELDINGDPHISYVTALDLSGQEIRCARKTGLTWSIDNIASGYLWGTSLVLDGSSNEHITYYEEGGGNPRIFYTYKSGSGWIRKEVYAGISHNSRKSIGFNKDGKPVICFNPFNDIDYDLRFATWNGSSWDIEVIDSGTYHISWQAEMVIDAQKNPHIVYNDGLSYPEHLMKYARRNGSSWIIENIEVDRWEARPWVCDLYLDGTGKPHITYTTREYVSGNYRYELKYGYFDGTSWSNELVEEAEVGSNRLVLDAQGYPHILYFDENTYELKHAYYIPESRFDTSALRIKAVPHTKQKDDKTKAKLKEGERKKGKDLASGIVE
ncbi:MAG: hypothetical protein JSW52_08075 [Candidatus Coatesbacteria bacterium]|nr:MAG: hypothetical protein JSW52_08075 [Candidatus Coatesbacteria bacterium]